MPVITYDRETIVVQNPTTNLTFRFTWSADTSVTPSVYMASGKIGPMSFSKTYINLDILQTELQESLDSVLPFAAEMQKIAQLKNPDRLKTDTFPFYVNDGSGQLPCSFIFNWDGDASPPSADLTLNLNGVNRKIQRDTPEEVQELLAMFGLLKKGLLGSLDNERENI